jgi:hypothetical protein
MSRRAIFGSKVAEQTGSQSYIPPDPKDDKALHTALDLIRGITKNSAYPPNPKTAVPTRIAPPADLSASIRYPIACFTDFHESSRIC